MYTEKELMTSAGYKEGLRLLGGQNGLNAGFDTGPDGLLIFCAAGDPVGSGDWQTAQRQLTDRPLPQIRY